MSTRRWLRMSWWNAVLALVVLAGAVAMAVLGRWLVAAIFLAVVVLVVASAVYARSGRARGIPRGSTCRSASKRCSRPRRS